MKTVDHRLSHLTKKTIEFRSMNTTLGLKLDELRKKIMRAKQAASSVRIAFVSSLILMRIVSLFILL